MPSSIVILTGAGISAESGIATFRDPDGIWSKIDYREVATPQGFAANLTDTILRLSYRDGFARPEPLPLGEPVGVALETPPVAVIFAPGHRIRVDISASNFPKYDVNPQTGAMPANATEHRIATATLFLGGDAAARLVLPVVAS